MYRVEIHVVDDSISVDWESRTVKVLHVGCAYNKRDIAERLALRSAEIINVSEPKITGKRRSD
jgi:hypothetical protein